jgi:hypothetical protein
VADPVAREDTSWSVAVTAISSIGSRAIHFSDGTDYGQVGSISIQGGAR